MTPEENLLEAMTHPSPSDQIGGYVLLIVGALFVLLIAYMFFDGARNIAKDLDRRFPRIRPDGTPDLPPD
ncbi:MAG TPA: hypothetical protein VKX28_06425 [Xanthobacteraceae bacterium]|nr:hypothetical protein [Xanthobacteraceae bacterium]